MSLSRILIRLIPLLALLGLVSCNLPSTEIPNQPGIGEAGGSQPLISTPWVELTGEDQLANIPRPYMGTEYGRFEPTVQGRLVEGGFDLVRRNGLLWSVIESERGRRDWEQAAGLENELGALSAAGIDVILVVRDAPVWARSVPEYGCSPILEGELDSFAEFLHAAVTRYSSPPYKVKYWELGNEPDVDPSLIPPTFPFGCWGVEDDPYYGGGYYGEMLKAAYPAIKAADPEAQVPIGGLLLDCDPTNPPEDRDCLPSRFLEGILENGGGENFDAVSYHGYTFFAGDLSQEAALTAWENRGGAVLGKAEFLREVLSSHGYEKKLFLTETSLLCPDWGGTNVYCNPPGESFFEAQADYVVWLYVRNWADGIAGTIWYHLEGPGWRHGSLLSPAQDPLPSYNAFRFLMTELRDAIYERRGSDASGLEIYQFSRADRQVWVVWSPDLQPRLLHLPENTVRVVDKYGSELLLAGDTLEVLHPVYVEINR